MVHRWCFVKQWCVNNRLGLGTSLGGFGLFLAAFGQFLAPRGLLGDPWAPLGRLLCSSRVKRQGLIRVSAKPALALEQTDYHPDRQCEVAPFSPVSDVTLVKELTEPSTRRLGVGALQLTVAGSAVRSARYVIAWADLTTHLANQWVGSHMSNRWIPRLRRERQGTEYLAHVGVYSKMRVGHPVCHAFAQYRNGLL